MQPIRLCLFWCKQFEETFENAQWRKIKQMQRMRLWILNKSKTNATNVTLPLLWHGVWRIIWKCTVEKSQTNATYATMNHLIKAIWDNIWKRTVEKSQRNATKATILGWTSTEKIIRKQTKEILCCRWKNPY